MLQGFEAAESLHVAGGWTVPLPEGIGSIPYCVWASNTHLAAILTPKSDEHSQGWHGLAQLLIVRVADHAYRWGQLYSWQLLAMVHT